jgi:prolyl oligopeptidase
MHGWISAVGLLATASAPVVAAAQAAGPAIPPAPVVATDEVVFGHPVSDPYRWMEDPAREADVTAWLTAASAASASRLAALPERPAFAALLEEATRAGTTYAGAVSAGDRLFYLRTAAADQVAKLIARAGGRERILLDPAGPDGAVSAINNFSVSPDGRTIAVHVAAGGGEVGELVFLDVETGARKGQALGPVWGQMQAVWLGDDLVAYTRMADPAPGVDPLQNGRVALIRPGDPGPGQFMLGRGVAISPPFSPEEFLAVAASPVSSLVLAVGTGARADYRLRVASRAALIAGRPTWRDLAAYEDQVTGYALLDDFVYYLTTLADDHGVVMRRRVTAAGLGPAQEMLRGGDLILTSLEATRDGVYVAAQRDGGARLLFLPDGAGQAQEIPLPTESDITRMRADEQGGSLVLGLISWTTPQRFHRVTGDRMTTLNLASQGWARAAAGVGMVREEAVSQDGTRVPMVLLLPRGPRTGPLPTIVNGYGSYGITTTAPWYHARVLPWAVHGGVAVLCGVRGGGERGRAWHEAGRSAAKPNAHADFIACAETLIARGYTTPGQLAATGTSAGGLVAPPAAMKRPDLFAALVPRVAILNPTRLAFGSNGVNQFAEMGDPTTPEGFAALLAQDSYLMAGEAGDIPDTLITIGLNDRRVSPWEGAKFAARASARFGARRQVLVRAEDAGHGIGSSRDQQNAEWADIFAFVWDRTSGSGLPQPTQ